MDNKKEWDIADKFLASQNRPMDKMRSAIIALLALILLCFSCKNEISKPSEHGYPIPYPDSDSKFYRYWQDGEIIGGHYREGHYELRIIQHYPLPNSEKN